MRRFSIRWKFTGMLVLAAALFFGSLDPAAADTEVKISGDAYIYENYWKQFQYTGLDYTGTQTLDPMSIYERFRVRLDCIANENLSFRLALKTSEVPWGHGTLTVDNPSPAFSKVYQAYVQFKWPGTHIEFTVGLQDMDLPFSVDWLDANPVFGSTRTASAMVSIPVADQLKIVGGFTRLLDTNAGFDPTTTAQAGDLDAFILTLPIELSGFTATPWSMIAVAGRDAGYGAVQVGNGGYSNETLATNLLSAASLGSGTGWKNSQNAYWWVGSTLALTALDPFKFYADLMYGSGNDTDHDRFKRRGSFFDLAAEYTGLDLLTPQATFWYSPGEDGSASNGSERMPSVVDYWSPSNSFLFDGDQAFDNGFMNINPVGAYGVVAALNKISFIQSLTHRLTVSFAHGDNSPAAFRAANALQGTGNYVQIGRDLTDKESVVAIGFDNKYDVYQNLALILETGWSHGDFQTSVWGHRLANATRDGDAYKVTVGLKYKY
jgi:hypothetical protein